MLHSSMIFYEKKKLPRQDFGGAAAGAAHKKKLPGIAFETKIPLSPVIAYQNDPIYGLRHCD